MAASSPDVAPSGFFVLRTPVLPLDALFRHSAELASRSLPLDDAALHVALDQDRARLVERLQSEVRDPVVREALFVASPSLDEAIEAWLRNPEDPRAHGVIDILVRYFARMTSRPTPFGLFSGCSIGTIGDRTNLTVDARGSCRRHTRLDTHYLAALCDALVRDPAIRSKLRFRPSTGLYRAAGRLRYAEARVDPKSRARSYHLVSVERTEALDATLRRAEHGARVSELVAALVESDPEIAREDAEAFVEELVESQILVSELAPPITGGEASEGILETLAEAAGDARAMLARANAALHALDASGLGLPASRYREVAGLLDALPGKPELARLFQVDLYKPGAGATLGADVVREMERAASLLVRVGRAPERDALKRFQERFMERYGERLDGPLSDASTVPLVEVLDDESGIGFPSPLGEGREPTPLLDGLPLLSESSTPLTPFGGREQHMLRRIGEAERAGRREWVLDDEDLKRLDTKSKARLPEAFSVIATLAARSREALDRGEFRVLVQGASGPSGALLLGRFCHGDAALRREVEAHLRAEEAARPDAIFAEVVHLPEGRLGNVLCRPALRDHEIAYLGRSGVPEERRIPITDLRIGVSRGRVVLYSSRHGCEVLPRLTSAHNHERAALGIYRFLCALQQQDVAPAYWSWGPLGGAPFLPRVSHGRVVLSAARWNLMKDQLAKLSQPSSAARFRAVQRLRAELGLPRWVALADNDNVLPVDLDNVLHVESFLQLVKTRDSAALLEPFTDEGLVAEGPEGRFVHELVVPFVRRAEPPPVMRAPPPARAVERTFLPGSDWLYAKLYTGTAGADQVLKEVVRPVIDAARTSDVPLCWFFVRYGDPQWHVRLRLRADRKQIASTLLPALHDAALPLLRDGRVSKLQLDTYEREIGRYGGADGIELAEALFEADSEAALAMVELLDPDSAAEERWQLTVRGMHLLLVDLGFDLAERTEIVRLVRTTFATEHGVDALVERQLGHKFRAERASLESLLATGLGAGHPLDPGFEVLARRSEKVAVIGRELSARARASRLTMSLPELAASFLHMHANRLLRAEHRAQELVLYDFLLRVYESEAARARRAR